MAKTIPQRELRNENAKVIDAVIAGTSFVVTRNGVPVAELHPVRTARRSFVTKIDLLALAAGGPHIDAKKFRTDLDLAIDQEL
jgi:prevent-host-death family protein